MKNGGVYQNSTEVANIHGVSFKLNDVVDACLYGRLNLFLQGDTGTGKTQLAKDAMAHFGDKGLFVLGRNDMDTRELFQQINLEKLRTGKSSAEIKELTDKIDAKIIVVDELPNCVPAVRAQLFNLFDGFIEINGKSYPIGDGYSVGIATGNLGQKFTESANDLGRALKDRMHVIVDVDHYFPSSTDTLDLLSKNTNPRVEFDVRPKDDSARIMGTYRKIVSSEVPLEKLLVANYLLHGLDYCNDHMSKRKMKDQWPNMVDNNGQGSDEALVLPLSPRAAKSVIRLSQSLDEIALSNGAKPETINENHFQSMMQAYKLVATYSGVLNEALVDATHNGDKYAAIDAVISTTKTEFDRNWDAINYGLALAEKGKVDGRILDKFAGRWEFMKETLKGIAKHYETETK